MRLVDITTPIGAIGFEDVRALPEGTRAEFERTASIDGSRGSSIAVSGTDVGAAAFRRSPYLRDVRQMDGDDDGTVYRLAWNDDRPELLRSISAMDGTVLSAVAVGDTASLELRFPDDVSASRFYAAHDDRVNPISIRRSSHETGAEVSSGTVLTDKQREALRGALDAGYFEIPRRVHLAELADEFGITDNAMSERLRRGTATLVRNADPDL